MEPGTQMGPLVSDEQFRRVTGFLESGQAERATALVGGGRYGDRGYFVEPTVLTNTRPEMKVVREELFGRKLLSFVVVGRPGDVAITATAATTQARMVSHGWCTTARPSAANVPWPAVPGLRLPPAARRTAEPVADACLLLPMSVPRCLASVWDVVIPVGGSSGKARAQVSG